MQTITITLSDSDELPPLELTIGQFCCFWDALGLTVTFTGEIDGRVLKSALDQFSESILSFEGWEKPEEIQAAIERLVEIAALGEQREAMVVWF